METVVDFNGHAEAFVVGYAEADVFHDVYVFVVVADIPYDSHFYAYDDINRTVNFKCIIDQHFVEHFILGFAAEIFFCDFFRGRGRAFCKLFASRGTFFASWNIFS